MMKLPDTLPVIVAHLQFTTDVHAKPDAEAVA